MFAGLAGKIFRSKKSVTSITGMKSRAQADGPGLKWIQAENRIEPDNVQAQTGLMQGAAGIGLFFIHLSELDGNAETANRFPDSPW